MASSLPPSVPMGNETPVSAALQHSHWRNHLDLSSGVATAERLLESAGFDRAPWLVVSFATGIAAWFVLANSWQWSAVIMGCIAASALALAGIRAEGQFPFLRNGLTIVPLLIAAGCCVVWVKSSVVGAAAIERPIVARLDVRILERKAQPAEARVRLMMMTRDPDSGRPIKVRLNLAGQNDLPALRPGAQARLRARLMPPARPMLPGGYDFARAAWFGGIAATGTVLGRVEIIQSAPGSPSLASTQAALAAHIRANLPGSEGSIAAALASGDRGAIAKRDEEAMRDAGLTHLLSISGLHVSALVAAIYLVVMRMFGLWPWLALRVRLPLVAAGAGALGGVAYTLLTGAEVPTVRSCIGAVLVLAALALGREALSMRMVAVAAFLVLLVWPEALVGPSFQMSFAAVIAIVALHGSEPVRRFLEPRDEAWWQRVLRHLTMLLVTGIVIEFALMPIGLFHFHRAGVYGALANVIAIPLTTFVSMPLIAIALILDAIGLGAPVWFLAGQSLSLLLGLAHWTAARPGAVTMLPAFGTLPFLACIAGLLWLALWHGRKRLLGLIPTLAGLAGLAAATPPDLLVSGDGRHVGVTGEHPQELLVLREGRSDFARDNLLEQAGMNGETRLIEDWPRARCSAEFCAFELNRGGREWRFLIATGREMVEERSLAAACERVDIVIADRWLPGSCRPAWFKADRRMLGQTGGLAIDLRGPEVRTVAGSMGEHGWWRPAPVLPRRPRPDRANSAVKPEPSPAQ